MTIEDNNLQGIAYQKRLRQQRENWAPEQWTEMAFKQQEANNKLLGKPNAWETCKDCTKRTDFPIDKVAGSISKLLAKGHENEVFMSKNGKDVIKYNNLSVSQTVDRFLNRIKAHNEFAQNAPYTIIGEDRNAKGEILIILQQPLIVGEHAPLMNIMQFLKENGFRPARLSSGVDGFTNGLYEISDLWKNDGSMRADNVLMDSDGNLYFIDADINYIETEK